MSTPFQMIGARYNEDLELKHKYLRRLGSPGNYTYVYDEPKGKQGSAKPTDDTKKTVTQEEIVLVSNLLKTLGFSRMAKDVRTVKSDKEFLKYVSVAKNYMVSKSPDDATKKKVLDLTNKLEKNVQARQ